MTPPRQPEQQPLLLPKSTGSNLGTIVLIRLERWLGLADGEGGRASRLLALIFMLSAALVLLKAAQSGIFLATYPKTTIPWAFAASAIVLATLSLLSVPMAARLGPVRLASITLSTAAASLLLLWGLLQLSLPHIPFVLYVVIEAFCGLLLIQVWSVVSEATNARSARRLMPVAGVGATTAWTLVGLLVPGITHITGAPGLLWLAPLLLFGCLSLVRAVARRDLSGESKAMVRKAPVIQEWKEGFAFVRSVPLMRVMALLSMLALVSEQLMDYQMMVAAQRRYGAPTSVASFFGTYYGVTSAVSLFSLLGVSGRALANLGASRSLLLVPSITALAALAATLFPSFWPIVVMRASDRVLKQSLWSSASEQAQTPLPVLRRAQARALIRGVIAPTGYALVALTLAMLPPSFDTQWLAPVTALVCVGMAVLILFTVRGAYQKALQQAVDNRKLDLGLSTTTPLDEEAYAVLSNELQSQDEQRAILAAELLRAAPTDASQALVLALEHPSSSVRLIALEGLERGLISTSRSMIERLLREDFDPAVRKAALRSLRGELEARSTVESVLQEKDPTVVVVAQVTLATMCSPHSFENGEILLPLLRSGDPSLVKEALNVLGPSCSEIPEVHEQLQKLLQAAPLSIRREILHLSTRLNLSSLLPLILELLDDPLLALDTAESFLQWEDGALLTSSTIAGGNAHLLLRLLSHPDQSVRDHTVRRVSRITHEKKHPLPKRDLIEPLLNQELIYVYRLSSILGGLAHDDGTPDWEIEPHFAFLAGEVERRILQTRMRVLHLLALMGNARIVHSIEFGLRRTSASVDAKVAELLDLVLEPTLSQRIVPLFDRLSLRERTEIAKKLGFLDQQALQDPLQTIVVLQDPLLLGCAALTYKNRFAERFSQIYEGLIPVLHLFERMTFLRSISLFSELSGEDLRSVAEIMEDVNYPAGVTIFRKGDPGEDLYLIVEGRVAIRDGKVELNTLGEREFFGELAVLDREPRSADVVCIYNTRLLRLRGADLGELMARRPQICEQIMLVLVRRLRGLTQRVVQ